MLVNNKGYIMEYWMLNTIIDCGEISNKQDLDINISQQELEFMNKNEHSLTKSEKLLYLSKSYNEPNLSKSDELDTNSFKSKNYKSVNKPKKLNKYPMNDNIINYNGNEYNEFNSNNRKCENTKYPKSKRYNRNNNESNRVYTEKESYQHIYLQKTANTNCNKREMQYLPKNSRLYEYGGTQRKVMLDSFTKPTLDNNYYAS